MPQPADGRGRRAGGVRGPVPGDAAAGRSGQGARLRARVGHQRLPAGAPGQDSVAAAAQPVPPRPASGLVRGIGRARPRGEPTRAAGRRAAARPRAGGARDALPARHVRRRDRRSARGQQGHRLVDSITGAGSARQDPEGAVMTPGELSRIEDRLRRAYGDVLESVRRDGSSPELMPGFQPGRPGRRFGRPGRAGSSRRLVPVAAAAAVAVIALVSGLIVPGALRPAAAPAVHLGYVGTTGAPQYFNPLRPYARFGWLPPQSPSFPPDGEVISQRMMSLDNPSGASLALYAAGACHLTGHTLNCSPSGNRYPLGQNIAQGDEHPAYWTAPQKAQSPLPGTSPGQLVWQYAVGGWAVLDYAASGHASAIDDAVKIA